MGTDCQAILTGNTLGGIKKKLGFELLRLRIGTPFTSKRTAFQKYQGPNPGAVMYGEPLDVKYGAGVTQIKLPKLSR